MSSTQDSLTSIGPALGGFVFLLVVTMGVVFAGFHQQETHLERMLQVSDLNESITTLERQLTDGYRFLSLSSDDLLGSRQGIDVMEFTSDFSQRLTEIDSLTHRVREASVLAGVAKGVEVSHRVDELRASWLRVINEVNDHPADATVELVTVSDPLSVELLSADLPSLVADILDIKQRATAKYERVSGWAFVIILLVFLAAYVIALILISHIVAVQKERQAIEIDLREAMEQAKAATYEKSRFLSNMSHELRTPMNGVIGMANVLASQHLPEGQKRMVSVLKESADSALALINDILDFEAIEAGKVTVEERSFELADVMRRIEAMASAQLLEKSIDFKVSLDSDLPTRVRGDEDRLSQILTNLVSNAIKFTEEGIVEVLVRNGGDSAISFTVRDTGIGIEPDQIDALFESFRQADNSIRRRFGGTGLGLSITRSLVHMMGGSIEVSSEPGQGSSFVIILPLPAVASSAARQFEPIVETPEGAVQSQPITVLCVDDNLINLEVAKAVIAEAGHECLAASSGREGLIQLNRNRVDVVLMDCHMDGLDGFDTARRMLESHPDLPIVALTADATTCAVEASQEAGMCGVMTKPFKPDILIDTIEGLAEGRAMCGGEGSPQGEVSASGVSSNSA